MYELMPQIVEYFARGGGGGSGGGGGGSSGGSGGELLFLIGYFVSHYLGKLVKKFLPRKAELIVSGLFAVIFSIIILAIGALGGFIGGIVAFCVIAGIWGGWAAAFFGLWDRLKKQSKKADEALVVAAQTNSTWNKQAILDLATRTFMQFQADWSTMNYANLPNYMTPSCAQHNSLLLRILQEMYRTNSVTNVQITNCLLIDVHDEIDNSRDSYTVAIEASANDQLIDNPTNTIIFQDNNTFTEYWTFTRSNNTWLLSNIAQQTADTGSLNQPLRNFATQNSMYYSLDMGWLFLPQRGDLFGTGKFGVSDINNHVVGTYHGHLVQFYTYKSNTEDKSTSSPKMVAQINLPKSYGGILIRPNKNFLMRNFGRQAPAGYQKYELEWPDFNKRYVVYATDADRLATFELLNPGFMAYLYDSEPGATIEVVDNIVYLYKETKLMEDVTGYEKFLTILLTAFKELKL